MSLQKVRLIDRCAAVVLTGAVLLSLTACNKKQNPSKKALKYSSGQVISEEDVFYETTKKDFVIPLDKDKKLDYQVFADTSIAGDYALVKYGVYYVIPDGVDKDDIEATAPYRHSATAVYDLDGNYILELSFEDDFQIATATSDKDDLLFLLGSYYDKDTGEDVFEIRVMSKTGELVRKIPLRSLNSLFMIYPELRILADGKIVVNQGGVSLSVFDDQGALLYEIKEMGRAVIGFPFESDGKYYILSAVYNMQYSDIQIKEVDIGTGTLGKAIKVEDIPADCRLTTGDSGIFMNTSNGFSTFDLKEKKTKELFDWNDTDMDLCDVRTAQCYPKNEKEFYALYRSSNNGACYVAHLTRAGKNPNTGKTILLIGGINISSQKEFLHFVSEYNRDPGKKMRAVVVDYMSRFSESDSGLSLAQQIYMETLSGEGPDILVNYASASEFGNDQVMVDLNPYIDGNDGISRDSFFSNVFRVNEKEGKLFHMPLKFTISGFISNTSYVDLENGWDFDDFEKAAASVPKDVSFIESMKYRSLLSIFLQSTMSDFVDEKAKTVDFQNEKMKTILRIVKEYGAKELPSDEGQQFEQIGTGFTWGGDLSAEKFEEGLLALKTTDITSLREYTSQKALQKGNVSFLGNPSFSKSGMTINVTLSLGITAKSKHPDLAWDLIRSYYSCNYGNEYFSYGFSVNRETWKAAAEKVMADYNAILDEEGEDDSMVPGTISPRIKDEDITDLENLILSASAGVCYDSAIFEIVCEEAEAYFAGDMTEDTVLNTIQKRALTVMKER